MKNIITLCLSLILIISTNAQDRKVDGKTYERVNPKENIPIYNREILVGNQTKTEWTFSKDTASEIFPLTLWDVKVAFKDDVSFLQWLNIYFRDDLEILRYDYFKHEYMLNEAYTASKLQPIK